MGANLPPAVNACLKPVGESRWIVTHYNWDKGAQLILVYTMIAILVYLLPVARQ